MTAGQNANDAWIDAIPESPYDPCPCGCGMKWRFAAKENPEAHYQKFVDDWNRLHPESQE
jgi:hypothetical protein